MIDKEYIDRLWQRCVNKVSLTAERIGGGLPYTTKDGKYQCRKDIEWWTNSFWTGIMWLMYEKTNEEKYRIYAEEGESKINGNFNQAEKIDHDAGFMWLLSSVCNYELTGNEQAKNYGILAAHMLAARFQLNGHFIRAWNSAGNEGVAIIDCMMNLPLLYWASDMINDNRLRNIAMSHADTVLKYFTYDDGHVNHIVEFDTDTGAFVRSIAGQGYADNSAWSRGQSWAINGFTQSYMYTGEERYLTAAKNAADYFIDACGENNLPLCDFMQPEDKDFIDSSAAAIAAEGLIKLYSVIEGDEKNKYLNAAISLVKALDERCCNWDNDNEAVLNYGMERYNSGYQALIYGDYYFMSAIAMLREIGEV